MTAIAQIYEEKALVYSLVLNPLYVKECIAANLEPADFADHRNGILYEALLEMWTEREKACRASANKVRVAIPAWNIAELEGQLKGTGKLAQAGGRDFLYSLPAVHLGPEIGIAERIALVRSHDE